VSTNIVKSFGIVTATVIPPPELLGPMPSWAEIVHHAFPRPDLPDEVNIWREGNRANIVRGWKALCRAREWDMPFIYGRLWIDVIRADGRRIHYGLASLRKVTNAGVNYIVDAFQNLTELENFKFHGIGTGTNAEAATDTALQTELSTQYNPDNTRATGTLGEGASANIFRTVGTNTVDAAVTITEHGIFTQAATGGGTLLDRSMFTPGVGLASGDSIQTTYELTINAGG
jgi:hypothetical protein